jgi:tetratricopeptide (TPR) repeat protein
VAAWPNSRRSDRLKPVLSLWAITLPATSKRPSLIRYARPVAGFLSDVQARPDSPEAGVAHRISGTTRLLAGEYLEAREHLERAIALLQPGLDDDLAFRFGHDAIAAAMLYLAMTLWPMGEVERAASFEAEAAARTAETTHIGALAYGKAHAVLFELMRGNFSRAVPTAVELARLAREYDLPMWRAVGDFFEGVVKGEISTSGDELADLRRAADLLLEQNKTFCGL